MNPLYGTAFAAAAPAIAPTRLTNMFALNATPAPSKSVSSGPSSFSSSPTGDAEGLAVGIAVGLGVAGDGLCVGEQLR